jgi:hypothetical protein
MPPLIPVDAIKATVANPAEPPQDQQHSGHMIIIERFERGATPSRDSDLLCLLSSKRVEMTGEW